ncbi:MAG: alanine--tRNA ligase [Candidatus Nanohaloarchaea archaeon]
MTSLEKLKDRIRDEASDNPDKFFATEVLREKGFSRGRCSNCGMHFWSADGDREFCGEPECSGGYTFINDSPTDETFSYVEAWETYRDFMSDRGYEPIDRYPVVARWRDDVEFVGGSIYNFQPYVVSGEAEPPAPELVVPQPSLRFNDIDNVGITGRHYVMHDHIGQTCFRPPEKYDQDRYFRDMFEFAIQALGIPEEKLILHEDAWGGGGNLGACMEFFVDGLELWNQVYMFYEQTPEGYEELDLKVLDMGMGHERITWISHGTETSYECVMPEVLEEMKERTGVDVNQELWEDFLPYSSYLNVDEVEDIDEKWEEIADELGVHVDELKDEIKPAAAMYSVAEHVRALMFALADGKLPSNTGEAHNLRIIYRRAMDFVEKYGWDIDLGEVAEWHAEELGPMFPELEDKLDEIKKIMEVEKRKYEKSREEARKKLDKMDGEPTVERMIELYESHGVSPEMMEERGIEVPEDFYTRVAEEDESVQEVEEKFDLEDVPETELLYYEDETQRQCRAEVVAVREDWVALDRTVFYPEGGGQEEDHGRIDGEKVVDTQKQDGVVLHHVPDHDLEKGDRVVGKLEWERRRQLMKHHSTTHMVNGATKDLLGDHIWQAGSHKSVEKGRLDVTHYEKPSREQLDRIEDRVKQVIEEDLEINKDRLKRSRAEQEYGFRIYQGGAVPGDTVRIVTIGEDFDVEACGGTHLSSTGEAGEFVVTGSRKVQDGVIRLEYRAGEAAEQYLNRIQNRVEEVEEVLGTESTREPREVQRELVDVFSVEPDQLEDTVRRFKREEEERRETIKRLADYTGSEIRMEEVSGKGTVERAESLFETWKEHEKTIEELEDRIEEVVEDRIDDGVEEEVPTDNVGLLIQVAKKLSSKHDTVVTLVGEKGAVSASGTDVSAREQLQKYSDDVQGDDSFAKAFDL